MRIEIDPDLRLFTRMTLGRRGRLVLVSALAVCAVIAASEWGAAASVGVRGVTRYYRQSPNVALELLLVTLAATAPAAALASAEQDGLLDFIRLSGRRPVRILLAAIVGVSAPYVGIVAIPLAVTVARFPVGLDIAIDAALMFMTGLVAALFVYGAMRGRPNRVAIFGIASVIAAAAVMSLMVGTGTVTGFMRHKQRAAVIVLASLPAALWLASTRLARPPSPAARLMPGPPAMRWMAAIDAPAEFMRQARSSLHITVTALPPALLLSLAMVFMPWVDDEGRQAGYWLLAMSAAAIGSLATLTAASWQIQTRSIDLVRMTPQSPVAIAFGWYAGATIPFAVVTAGLVVALRLLAPAFPATASPSPWWAVAVAIAAPAIALADGLHHRQSGTVVVTLLAAVPFFAMYLGDSAIAGARTGSARWTTEFVPAIPMFVVAIGLAAAIGRMRRPNGPALVGGAAFAALLALAAAATIVPSAASSRVAAALPVLLASLLADEGDVATPPWSRLAIATISAFAAIAIVARAGGAELVATATTGVGAALAVGIALLGAELLRGRVLSLLLPIAVIGVLLRTPRSAVNTPPSFTTIDLALLGSGLAAAAFASVMLRRRDAATAHAA